MGPLGFDGHLLSLVMKAGRKHALVDDISVGTQEADAPAFQTFEQLDKGGLVATAAFPIDQAAGIAINGGPDPEFVGLAAKVMRSEEHTSELQSRQYLVCRLLLEKKK